jgi:hypothetical protein
MMLLTVHARVQRGVGVLEDHLHAWRRMALRSRRRWPSARDSRPAILDCRRPSALPDWPSSVRPAVLLPQPLSPTRPSVSPLVDLEADSPSTALHVAGDALEEQPLADGEVLGQLDDADEWVVVGGWSFVVGH